MALLLCAARCCFADATTLNTSEGGFVFANNAGTLTYAAVKNASVNGRQAERPAPLRFNSLDGEDWEVRFMLESGTIINELSGVGMHPNAHTGFDAFDDFTLPRFGNYLELNHSKELHGSAYSRDIVSPAAAFSWHFEVDVAEPGPVTLQWSNLHLQGSTKKLVLWDMDAHLPVNLEQVTKYKFNAPRKFALHYGNSEYLSDKLSDLQIALYAPYPNPAAGDVELQVWIPDADIYALEVIDPLGRMVHSLFNEKVEAGHHRFLWQRTEPTAPGLYLVKLSNNKHSVYQKLVIH